MSPLNILQHCTHILGTKRQLLMASATFCCILFDGEQDLSPLFYFLSLQYNDLAIKQGALMSTAYTNAMPLNGSVWILCPA